LGKLDARSDEGIFLGYSSYRNDFKVLNKRLMCVEERVHVVFDETNVIANQSLQDEPLRLYAENEHEHVNKQGPSPAGDVNIALSFGENE